MITLDDITILLMYSCWVECGHIRKCGGTCCDMLDLSYEMIIAGDY